MDASDVVAHPRARLVGDRSELLVAGQRPRERGDVLLPAGGRGHGVGVDIPRSGVRDADGGRASSAARKAAAVVASRVAALVARRARPARRGCSRLSGRRPRRAVTCTKHGDPDAVSFQVCPATRGERRSSCGREASGLCMSPRGRCVSSCRASTRRATLRPRRWRCGARSWRRWSGRRCASCRRRLWTCGGSRDFGPRRWVYPRCRCRGTGRCARGVVTWRRRVSRGATCRSSRRGSQGRSSRGRRRAPSWR